MVIKYWSVDDKLGVHYFSFSCQLQPDAHRLTYIWRHVLQPGLKLGYLTTFDDPDGDLVLELIRYPNRVYETKNLQVNILLMTNHV